MHPAMPQSEGRLHYAVCRHCGHAQAGTAPRCTRCGHAELDARSSAGTGSIFSFTTVHRAPSPAWRVHTPYVIVLVDMDEGFRVMLNLRSTAEPAIGQRVRVLVEDDAVPVAVPA